MKPDDGYDFGRQIGIYVVLGLIAAVLIHFVLPPK